MRAFLLAVGLPDVTIEWLILVLAIIALCAIAFGWLTDLILSDGAFGVFLNAFIGLAAAAFGAWAWQHFGMTTGDLRHVPKAAVAASSALTGLLLAVVAWRTA